jgi:hypothetical protein
VKQRNEVVIRIDTHTVFERNGKIKYTPKAQEDSAQPVGKVSQAIAHWQAFLCAPQPRQRSVDAAKNGG